MQDAALARPNPIALAKYSFLIGGSPLQDKELIEALLARDNYLEAQSILSPVYDATCIIAWGEFRSTDHLLSRLSEPLSDIATIGTLMTEVQEAIGAAMGPQGFGHLALRRAADFIDLTCDRILFTEAEPEHLIPFLEQYPDDCLAIVAGPLMSLGIAAKQVVWLPMPSTTERMALLERELGVVE